MRYKRYRDKITYIVDRLEQLPEEPRTRVEKSSIFYDLHTSIEAAIDILAMYIKDNGLQVDDDYANIDKLEELNVDPEIAPCLRNCNGMRNHIVHRYNTFDEQIVFNAIPEIKNCMYRWIEVVEVFIGEFRPESNTGGSEPTE